jgi:hypothetical protein
MIRYEWVIEELDEYDDIRDVDHADTYARAEVKAAALRAGGKRVEVALVRDTLTIDGMVEDREWAYIENGKLPARFDEGTPVPQKYRKEVK